MSTDGMTSDQENEKITDENIDSTYIESMSNINNHLGTQDYQNTIKSGTLTSNLHAKKRSSIGYKSVKVNLEKGKFSFRKYLGKTINKLLGLGNNKVGNKQDFSKKYSVDPDLSSINNQSKAITKNDFMSLGDININTKIAHPSALDEYNENNKSSFFKRKLNDVINHAVAEKLNERNYKLNIISINLVMEKDKHITGKHLLPQILAAGLRYGDMSIFHRYSNTDGTGKILFSLANGVEPGTFNLDKFENQQIYALTFFMTIPGADAIMQAFASMINTATVFADHFNVEMKDKDFCDITNQTIEHYRQCIRDFQRKQLLTKSTF